MLFIYCTNQAVVKKIKLRETDSVTQIKQNCDLPVLPYW